MGKGGECPTTFLKGGHCPPPNTHTLLRQYTGADLENEKGGFVLLYAHLRGAKILPSHAHFYHRARVQGSID